MLSFMLNQDVFVLFQNLSMFLQFLITFLSLGMHLQNKETDLNVTIFRSRTGTFAK